PRYEELNRAAGLTRHLEWIQSGPGGDLLIVVFELPAPEKLGFAFEDEDDYDRWWRARPTHPRVPSRDGGRAPATALRLGSGRAERRARQPLILASRSSVGISVGESATRKPAASSASTF